MGNSDYLFARPTFISGIARLFDFSGTLNVYNISPDEQTADMRAFQEDWKALGNDMRAALAAYKEEQELRRIHG